MNPQLLKMIEDALTEASAHRTELMKAPLKGASIGCIAEQRAWGRHASITITHLEDALLRARLSYGIGEPV